MRSLDKRWTCPVGMLRIREESFPREIRLRDPKLQLGKVCGSPLRPDDVVLHPFAQVQIEMDVSMVGSNWNLKSWKDNNNFEDEFPYVPMPQNCDQMGFPGSIFLDSSSCRAFLTLCVETKTPWKPLSSMRSSFQSGTPCILLRSACVQDCSWSTISAVKACFFSRSFRILLGEFLENILRMRSEVLRAKVMRCSGSIAD